MLALSIGSNNFIRRGKGHNLRNKQVLRNFGIVEQYVETKENLDWKSVF
jgi:hypothetical protein